MTNPTGTQAVDRALGLLTEIMDAQHPLTFGELAESSGLAKSTLSRLLSSLENATLVSRTSTGAFRSGAALSRFAYSHLPNEELLEFAEPAMAALGEATGETINLAVLLGHEVEQISQVDCSFHIGGVNWGVSRVPLHCSALGKVFLAHGAQLPKGRLARLTPRSITKRSELAAQCEVIRERGWSIADSELETGLIAIAAPIFRHNGEIIAAMSISGPTMRMTREVSEDYAQLLLAQTSEVSEKFGFTVSNDASHSSDKQSPNSGTSEQPVSRVPQVRRKVGAA